MKCSQCGGHDSAVTDSRMSADKEFKWRRRKCKACGHIWYTTETENGSAQTKNIVPCDFCVIGGKCKIEAALRAAGRLKPFCSAGKKRNDDGKNKGST